MEDWVRKGVQYTSYHHIIYEAVLSMMVDFASGSCISSDDKDGNIGIKLSNKIPASMKKVKYKVIVVCAKTNFVYVSVSACRDQEKKKEFYVFTA
eukprot:15341237-Ditylum_brightwellii.AAC.1